MKLTYTKITDEYRSGGESTYYGDTVTYEPTDKELLSALAEIICDNYFTGKGETKEAKGLIRQLIIDADIRDELAETYEDSLKEYFEPLAMAS